MRKSMAAALARAKAFGVPTVAYHVARHGLAHLPLSHRARRCWRVIEHRAAMQRLLHHINRGLRRDGWRCCWRLGVDVVQRRRALYETCDYCDPADLRRDARPAARARDRDGPSRPAPCSLSRDDERVRVRCCPEMAHAAVRRPSRSSTPSTAGSTRTLERTAARPARQVPSAAGLKRARVTWKRSTPAAEWRPRWRQAFRQDLGAQRASSSATPAPSAAHWPWENMEAADRAWRRLR